MRALSFTLVLSFLNVAAYLSDMPTVPEFSELKTTEGIIDFDKPTRRGTNLMILRKNKDPLILICSGGANVSHDCIYPEQRIEEYRGKQAKVWWLEQQTLLGMREKLVQLQIGQNIVISYEQQKKTYQSYSGGITRIGLFLLLLSLYLIAMPLRYISETQRKLRVK